MSSRSRRRGVVLVLTMSLVTVLAACGTDGASSVAPASPAPASVAPTPEPSASSAAAFPVTLTDDEGTAVTIPADPQRIVSLSPANTEILFALGAGDQVVATDSTSDYPEGAVALPDVADFATVDIEQVTALDADLIVAAGLGFTPAEAITQLRALDIPVVVVYAPTVEGVYHDIELIGSAVGAAPSATQLVRSMRSEIDAISAAVAGESKPRVFYEIGYTDATGQIFAPADQSFVAEMVTLAGADAITTGDPNDYEIPLEQLIEADPEIILLGVNPYYSPTPAGVASRTGWDVITAVKDGAIRPVHDIEITRPGPRLATGLRNLAAAIWPDIVLPTALPSR